jgi:hypothetical protein
VAPERGSSWTTSKLSAVPATHLHVLDLVGRATARDRLHRLRSHAFPVSSCGASSPCTTVTGPPPGDAVVSVEQGAVQIRGLRLGRHGGDGDRCCGEEDRRETGGRARRPHDSAPHGEGRTVGGSGSAATIEGSLARVRAGCHRCAATCHRCWGTFRRAASRCDRQASGCSGCNGLEEPDQVV